MEVNAGSYRWSESCGKVCQMCDMGEGEAVEHVVLECVKYARDRNEMIQGNHQSGEDRKGVHGAAAGTVWGDE